MVSRTRMSLTVAALALFAQTMPSLAQKPLDDCPAEQAVYRLQTEDGPLEMGFLQAANFASVASDLYLYLTTSQRTYWFSFSVSNGYSGITLVPVSDPGAEEARESGPRALLERDFGDEAILADIWKSLRFYALDADMTFQFGPPVSGGQAPAYMMVPEIGLPLWYSPQALTEDKTALRDSIPRGIFQFDSCLPEPRAPVVRDR